MTLIVSLSARISPFTSTVIFLERSPLATAVVTSAMLRTWPVRLSAMRLTLSVRSFPCAGNAAHLRLSAQLALRCRLRGATRVTSEAERIELIDHGVDGVLQLEDFAFHVDGDLLGQVAERHGRGDFGNVCAPGRSGFAAMAFTLSVRSFHVPPTPGNLRLPAEPSPRCPTSRATRVHFRCETVELVDHDVDGVLQLKDFALSRPP